MFRKIVVFCVLSSFLAVTLGEETPVKINPIEPFPGLNTTVTPPTSTTPTHTNVTTAPTPPPTNTTTAPTPTPAPSNTTTAPTPTPAPSNTTTAPTPTPGPVPANVTVTPPTPLPPAETGKWKVVTNNVTCIMADIAIQVDVCYELDNKTLHSSFDVPVNASTENSFCGNNTQELILTWSPAGKNNISLSLTFDKNETSKHFVLSLIDLKATVDELFPDIQNSSLLVLQNNVSQFSTPVTKSYRCAKEQQIKLSEISNVTSAVIKISHVQWEAFHEDKGEAKFGTAEDCSSSGSPDIVPIAVGCALVGLVAIVLIAYLMGRRRSQARGYLSM